jgi:hypothetical protein
MTDRKHSPDVLAELLGAELPPSPAPDLTPTVPALRARATRAPKSQPHEAQGSVEPFSVATPGPVAPPAPPAWETEIVTCQNHRGWRPRYVNGSELKNWLTGPLIHDYLSRRGEEGWELAGTSATDRFYGAADNLQLYFKRRK